MWTYNYGTYFHAYMLTYKSYVFLQVPEMNEATVKSYLDLFNQDLKSKPKDMYHAKFLRNIRASSVANDIYICGRVSTEMSKKVVYEVDVLIDEHKVISKTQCECAAQGWGLTHIANMLLAVVLYTLTKVKEGIITMETCTQMLQTFHQTKKYTGSPVKMQDLKLRTTDSLSHIVRFDPRPIEMRASIEYPDQFRNVWLNSSGPNLPVRQLFPPANMFGVTHDHDYLLKTPEDNFLDAMYVSVITDEERKDVELRTRGQSSNKLWSEERTKCLHASNYRPLINLFQ